MNIPRLFENARFVGKAEGEKLTYHVFEGPQHFLVLSANSRGGFTLNPVAKEAPLIISRSFGGKRVTPQDVAGHSRRPDLFALPFAAHNALYVMVALGKAHKLKKKVGRAMNFKIKR